MATLSGGDKIGAALAAISERMSGSVKVGFLEGATYPDTGIPVAQVAFWNEYGTSRAPARPFFRRMIANNSAGWGARIAGAAKYFEYDGAKVLGLMGLTIAEELQQSITDWKDPPNAPYTIAKKGFDKPLTDTGHMKSSVDFEVEE